MYITTPIHTIMECHTKQDQGIHVQDEEDPTRTHLVKQGCAISGRGSHSEDYWMEVDRVAQ